MDTMRQIIDAATPTTLLEGRALYEADEHAWIGRQIGHLREGNLGRLDRDSLIEFLTEMTVRDRRELGNRLGVLLLHLLKVKYQPERLSSSWVRTIREQQQQITSLLDEIPSLRPLAPDYLEKAYPGAVRGASQETGLDAATFPVASSWSVDEALAFEPPEPTRRKGRRR